MAFQRLAAHRLGYMDSDQKTALDAVGDAGLTFDAANDRLEITASKMLINAEAAGGTPKAGELAIGCSDATYGRALRLEHSTSASFNTFMNYSGVSGDVSGAMSGTSLSRMGIASGGDMTAYGDLKIAAEKVIEFGAVASMGYESATSNVQFDGSAFDMNSQNLLNAGGVGGDNRTIYTRTFEIEVADLTGKGAVTTATHTLFTLGANEGVRWVWMENTGIAVAGGPGLYLSIGKSSDLDSLYIQRDMGGANHIEDDNANHGVDLGAYAELGDADYGSPTQDATVYYGDSEILKVESTTTSGNHNAITGGGSWYVHVEIVRVDTSQVEAVS